MDVYDVIIGRLVREIAKYQAYRDEFKDDKEMKLIMDSKIDALKRAIEIIREETDY